MIITLIKGYKIELKLQRRRINYTAKYESELSHAFLLKYELIYYYKNVKQNK